MLATRHTTRRSGESRTNLRTCIFVCMRARKRNTCAHRRLPAFSRANPRVCGLQTRVFALKIRVFAGYEQGEFACAHARTSAPGTQRSTTRAQTIAARMWCAPSVSGASRYTRAAILAGRSDDSTPCPRCELRAPLSLAEGPNADHGRSSARADPWTRVVCAPVAGARIALHSHGRTGSPLTSLGGTGSDWQRAGGSRHGDGRPGLGRAGRGRGHHLR